MPLYTIELPSPPEGYEVQPIAISDPPLDSYILLKTHDYIWGVYIDDLTVLWS